MQGLNIIFGIVILILSVVVHEVSHGYAANALGDPTAKYAGRLTLNPIPHLDIWGSIIIPFFTFILGGFIFGWAKPVPYNPYNLRHGKWGPAFVAGAGPLSNLSIAFIFGMVIRFGGSFLPGSFIVIAGSVVLINILLAVFNLVPIPPLDGSKVLFALLPYRHNHIQQFLEQYGFFILLIFIFFFFQLLLPLISLIFRLFTGI